MMLALARNIPQADASLKRGEWNRKKFLGMELFEKTLGILGLGKVGREVAVRCKAFGMKLLAFDPVLSADAAKDLGIELVGVKDLLRRSDIITIHTPLTNETRGIIGKSGFAICKKGVRIVNCARGGIVDEGALLDALNAGIVGGAALDVFVTEPPGDNPLLKHPKVIATPHLGASTEEAQEKVAEQVARQVADALHGRGVAGSVNADEFNKAMRAEVKPYLLLAEKFGLLVAQLKNGALRSLILRVHGGVLFESREILGAAFLKGMFSAVLEEPINYLNAPLIARERGIRLETIAGEKHENYSSLLSVRFETEKEKREISGTVFDNDRLRIVGIDGFHFEANPEGHLLFYSNVDRPGVVASVSRILAKASINIAGMSLGRYGVGREALTIMAVDSAIPATILAEIASVEGLLEVKTVFLGK